MDAKSLLAKPWLPGVELFHADFSGQAFGRHSHDAFAIVDSFQLAHFILSLSAKRTD